MARRAFDEWQSLACASFVLFCSQLNAFAPPMSSYLKELYRGSDVLGVFLVYLTIYFLLGFTNRRTKWPMPLLLGNEWTCLFDETRELDPLCHLWCSTFSLFPSDTNGATDHQYSFYSLSHSLPLHIFCTSALSLAYGHLQAR